MTDLLSVVSEAERNSFPTISQLSENDVDSIWSNVSSFVERQMTLQKGVYIPGLGTFTFSQQKLDVGNKFVLIQRPVFLLSEKLSQSHGLKQVKPLSAAGDVPVVQLNFTALSVESPFERHVVEGCVRETLLVLLRAVAAGRSVLFTVHAIGELSFCQSKVKMKFYHDFVTAMDGSGKLLRALSNRPGTSNSLLFGRGSSIQGPGTSNTIILPKISSEQRGKDWGEETLAQVQTNSDRKEENGESPVTPRSRSRHTLGPAKVNGIILTDDLEPRPPAETNTDRSTVSILPLQGAALKQGKVKRGDSHLDVPCVDHNRAGQELCYLCMQRAQRNIPHYLAEERLREQQEEERVLLVNEQRRDQCYLQREQADRLEKRENNQKVAAFNLGVSEAMKEKKGSYIFGGRPLTPPRVHKQRGYMKDLRAQAEWREDQVSMTQQDQELIDLLHQVQLAQEITLHKSQQLHLKQKNTSCYKKALDIQVECQGTGLPACQPDSDGPVFGQLDCTPAGLSEQRQRAEKVYQEQLTTANNKRKEQLLNRCTKQKNEREMLNRNRKELINDHINRFEKLHNLRASLEETWRHSADLKRHRDREEKEFIRSGSSLLIDQCEQYRRCYQCKRKTENCGETNIWKKSHYIPGSRLMV
ncbi:coiled-coil domain-containing protein 81-like isoform X2 [Coregonus clupeaformis]|uniref:coiled-coil domain-containing protein 81-like isoform X2 n=1 Tax=Coregonus clupeaformis TaxID=59861 RepID=UPI001E1C617B|nr:coiled-coil domain-containing protein 81-like isoform X2 [Coregonus clupeaformis]